MTAITRRHFETNGLRMHVAEAGTGPLVLLLHGFPECRYSWRSQLTALAEAGFTPWPPMAARRAAYGDAHYQVNAALTGFAAATT